MILVKIHQDFRRRERQVFAICDAELIGKTIKEGDISLEVTERFYRGTPYAQEQVVEFMRDGNNLNMVGKESIQLAIHNDIIEPSTIRTLQGIPIAMIYNG